MRRSVKNRQYPQPDTRFQSVKVGKFVNYCMKGGKKTAAQKMVYGAFDIIAKETGGDPLETFETAIKNIGPSMEVRSRRVGGANYQVPREVRPERRLTLAMRWLLQATRAKSGQPAAKSLAEEIMAAANNEGAAVKKKEDTHKMAEANRAFAHFAW